MSDKEDINEFVNKVRERSDIFSVVSRYVTLIRKGNKYWACCPFHSEKTASFSISPEKGFFYCFGCHTGGNVFNFISQIEHITYFEAVKLQAERLGIPLPTFNKSKSSEELRREREEKALIQINTMARDFFHNCLILTTHGEHGRKYLKSRGINEETIESFNIGFAPDSWNKLSNDFIKKKDVKPELLIAAGLSAARKNGNGIYDRFRNRVMIPIVDIYGHVVAFGGRVIDDDSANVKNDNQNDIVSPKYLNTPETLIFNKGNLLFGLNRASSEITKIGYAIIVEGYMDVISAASAGIKNIVASLGTSFTVDQAKLLMRYTRKFYFCYDSDSAGQKATMRALPIVLNQGAEAKVIVIPDGKDPDEFIRKHGVEEFKQLIEKALSLIDYRIRHVMLNTELTTLDGKISALRQIIPVLREIKDSARRIEYRKKIAATLLIEEDIVDDELRKFSSNPQPISSKFSWQSKESLKQSLPTNQIQTSQTQSENNSKINPNVSEEGDSIWEASRIILRTAWYENDTLFYVLANIPKEMFPKIHQEIINYIQKCMDKEEPVNDIGAAEELSKEAMAEVSKFLLESEINTIDRAQAYKDSINILMLAWEKSRYAKIMGEIADILKENPNYDDNPKYIEKMQESLKIKRAIDALKVL